LTLRINGAELAWSHFGSRRIVVQDACKSLRAGEAEIVIEVKDSAERFQVSLPQGLPGPGRIGEYV